MATPPEASTSRGLFYASMRGVYTARRTLRARHTTGSFSEREGTAGLPAGPPPPATACRVEHQARARLRATLTQKARAA